MKQDTSTQSAGANMSPPVPKAAETWASLTWDQLEDWAGGRSVSRGQAYQRQGRVKDLAIAADGRLLATVLGLVPGVAPA